MGGRLLQHAIFEDDRVGRHVHALENERVGRLGCRDEEVDGFGPGRDRLDIDFALVLVALENDLARRIDCREGLSRVSIDGSHTAAIARIDVAKHLGDVGTIDFDAGGFLQCDGGLDRDTIARLDRLQRQHGCAATQQRQHYQRLQKPWLPIRHCPSP